VQNIPRDIRFRKLIKARPGHLILSVDYSAIELRIASVLADRSIAEIRWRIENQKLENCFLIQARRGMLAPELLPLDPTDGVHDSLDMVLAVAQRVLIREPQSMSMVFLRGLDPHLVTAADMARRQGRLAFEGNPIEWIATLTSDARRDCRIELEVERQKAKAANFGLLYGMGARGFHAHGMRQYGLTWSQNDARFARNAWFDLYPEFRLWQWYTRHVQTKPPLYALQEFVRISR
jgi:hypothetical protein